MTEQQPIETATLDSLQSAEQQSLLNEIDKLRAHGVSDFVSLPQLVCCGDQSSGKSSVLEAITEIPFPRKDNLCTRFATQIVLRRAEEVTVRVRILPAAQSDEARIEKLKSFGVGLDKLENLPDLMEAAKVAMGVGPPGVGRTFSSDVLSIELSGPGRPQLTVVDLPGLIHTADSAEGRSDVELVSELVHKYMVDERTIILAIVSAKNDHQNQIILERARKVDPLGRRTLGIITKPDTLSPGSESESEYLALARNEKINLKLGWAVVRNRNYEERDDSFEQRNLNEVTFFQKGAWRNLPRETVGITALRSRLSTLLLNHIKQELPRVREEIEKALEYCESRLGKMGQKRSSEEEQRTFLFDAAEAFEGVCKAAVSGIYENTFFAAAVEEVAVERHLRATIQNSNAAFAQKMRLKGQWRTVLTETQTVTPCGASNLMLIDDTPNATETRRILTREEALRTITREQAVEWIKPILLRSRGRELPGTYQPLLIGELFWEQTKPWEEISTRHVKDMWLICYKFVFNTLKEFVPEETVNLLLEYHVKDKMQARLDSAIEELKELLADRRIVQTYNHYYTETVQKIKHERLKTSVEDKIKSITQEGRNTVKADMLLKLLSEPTELNMDNYACKEILDYMLAYYEVASKTFVDNVATIVVERRIVRGLWEVFMSRSILTMPSETVSNIAAESSEDQNTRQQLETKKKSLGVGLEVCRKASKGIRGGSNSLQEFAKKLESPLFAFEHDQRMGSTTPPAETSPTKTPAAEAISRGDSSPQPSSSCASEADSTDQSSTISQSFVPGINIFGETNNTGRSTPGRLFGGATNTVPSNVTPGGLFGGATNTVPSTPSGLFGGATNTVSSTPGGLFGGATNTVPSTTGGLFGGATNTGRGVTEGLFSSSTTDKSPSSTTWHFDSGLQATHTATKSPPAAPVRITKKISKR